MQRLRRETGRALEVDDDDVGVVAHRQRPLAVAEPHDLRRPLRQQFDQTAERDAAGDRLVQEQRQRRLDAEDAGRDVPHALERLVRRPMWRVVGGDDLDVATCDRLPQRVLVGL